MSDLTDVKFFLASLIRPIVKEAIRDEINALNNSILHPQDEIGGIKLAEEVTGLSKPRIYTLVSERKLPHSKRGNRLFFTRSQLTEWAMQGNREQKGGIQA